MNLYEKLTEEKLSQLNVLEYPTIQNHICDFLTSKNYVSELTLEECHCLNLYIGNGSGSNPNDVYDMFNTKAI